MKLRKEFIDAIINDRATNAGQWQLQVERIQLNYVFITDLLKKVQPLSSEEIRQCQGFQEQLIRLLAQFIADMDELDENRAASHSDTQALFDLHIQQMSELNEGIRIFLNSLSSAP